MPPKKAAKGAKAKKQQGGKAKSRGAGNRRNNPKAFAAASGTKAQAKNAYRTLEKQERKYHISLTDRSVDVEVSPPFVVAVVGPPGVGKSTLIRSLVKHWTKQNLNDPVGPITIITGKKRRITVIECPNDLNAMCDVAKVADLVLLMVDGAFGFEMETFEFLNMCQVHGFPRVMGVLTHLDSFTNPTTLRRTKKTMKHRFWTDIYEGCKLFYLSGLKHGRYPKTEVANHLPPFTSAYSTSSYLHLPPLTSILTLLRIPLFTGGQPRALHLSHEVPTPYLAQLAPVGAG